MKQIFLDDITKEAATDFANREAEIKGFKIGSPQWKSCFKKYLGFAVGTMTVGRNPMKKFNPRDENTWPEIFSDNGFAGQVAKNYKSRESVSARDIRERIKAAATSLAYMYLNGIYGVKTTTATRETGAITPDKMSDIQLRGSSDNFPKSEADAENIDVAWNQLALTVIESAVYEYLLPFFTMKPDEVQKILDGVTIEGRVTAKGMADARTETEKRIRRSIGDRLKDLRFDKLVTGK